MPRNFRDLAVVNLQWKVPTQNKCLNVTIYDETLIGRNVAVRVLWESDV